LASLDWMFFSTLESFLEDCRTEPIFLILAYVRWNIYHSAMCEQEREREREREGETIAGR